MTDGPPPLLDDGTPPATPEDLLRRLEELDISATTLRHPPVFTVEESQKLKGDLPGAHTKNLFLRDKKGSMWLVVALYDRDVDLKKLAKTLAVSGRFSFGSEDRLMRYLGVTPGSVTPYAVLNDHGGQVRVALDTGLEDYDLWNAHPLDNAMTTTVKGEDLLRFLEAEDHRPVWVEL
ncbi:MAG: prolyl-tRNA synthetase associated domain-containing protein [Gemmatimonadota bacterium]|jgi:Ala-tRNA(Pro) deacylase